MHTSMTDMVPLPPKLSAQTDAARLWAEASGIRVGWGRRSVGIARLGYAGQVSTFRWAQP